MAHRKLAIFRRRIFTALSVLSLLLCIATLALWVRSYWRWDGITYYRIGEGGASVHSLRGEIQLATAIIQIENPDFRIRDDHFWTFQNGEAHDALKLANVPEATVILGFGFASESLPQYHYRAIAIPHWFLALLFAILAALHLRAIIRSRRRNRTGHCPRCGYDLRATPERCPECGEEVRSQKSEVSNGKTANPLTSDL